MAGGHKYQAALEKYKHEMKVFEEAGGRLKPKKPTNAWDTFCSLNRNRVTRDLKTEHGEAFEQTLVIRELGQEYRALSDDEKKSFKEKVEAAKLRYKEDLVKYQAFKRKQGEDSLDFSPQSGPPQKRHVFR